MPGEVVVVGQGDHAQAWSGRELALDAEGAFEFANEETDVKTQTGASHGR